MHTLLAGLTIGGFLLISYPLIKYEQWLGKKDLMKQRLQSLAIVQKVLGLVFRFTGSKLTVLGRERIPEGAVLYVANHRSYFDIVVSYPLVPGPTGFVAKKEMERCLTLTGWMRLVNCLFLDREDIKAGFKTIMDAVRQVKDGISIWIFPEGTRNTSEDIAELMPFHEGSIKIAEKSGCPVIPVAITGTQEIWEKHLPWVRPSRVTVEFGEPVYLKELPAGLRKHYGMYIRERIIQMLKDEQIRRG